MEVDTAAQSQPVTTTRVAALGSVTLLPPGGDWETATTGDRHKRQATSKIACVSSVWTKLGVVPRCHAEEARRDGEEKDEEEEEDAVAVAVADATTLTLDGANLGPRDKRASVRMRIGGWFCCCSNDVLEVSRILSSVTTVAMST